MIKSLNLEACKKNIDISYGGSNHTKGRIVESRLFAQLPPSMCPNQEIVM